MWENQVQTYWAVSPGCPLSSVSPGCPSSSLWIQGCEVLGSGRGLTPLFPSLLRVSLSAETFALLWGLFMRLCDMTLTLFQSPSQQPGPWSFFGGGEQHPSPTPWAVSGQLPWSGQHRESTRRLFLHESSLCLVELACLSHAFFWAQTMEVMDPESVSSPCENSILWK